MPHPPQDLPEKAVRGAERLTLGLWGEKTAEEYLVRRGYRIEDRRYRCREGEIDLVASGGGFLCFVEVKLRKDASMGEAREYVTRSKQRKVRTAALRYLAGHPTGLQPRFDVVEVYAPQGTRTKEPVVRLWENAF